MIVVDFSGERLFHIGNIAGIVEEMILTYMKILALNYSFNKEPEVLDQDFTNYRLSGSAPLLYCYSFDLTFDQALPSDQLKKMFDEVIEQYAERLPRKAEYAMTGLTSFARLIGSIYTWKAKGILLYNATS